MLRPALLAALLVLLFLAPAALAQGESPVVFESSRSLARTASPGEPIVVVWNATNLNARTEFVISATAELPPHWTAEFSPKRGAIAPRGEATIQATFSASESAAVESSIAVTFSVMNTDTGAVSRVTQTVAVTLAKEARFLDKYDVPLPVALGNGYGIFTLEVAFWALVALAGMWAGNAIVRLLVRRAGARVAHEIISKLRVPAFSMWFLLGVKNAFDALPPSGVARFAENVLAVVAVGIIGAYLAHRIFDAFLHYYSAEIAPRTNSKIDDVLVPALRKLSVVVVGVFSFGYALKHLFGIELTFLFGAAGIAGLVIAFAAQDTLSNFFSGVFLLLDQPFAEGEDIQLETGEVCRVEKIGLRSTDLYHYRNHEEIVVPNNQLASGRIVNITRPDAHYRCTVTVGVAYGSNLEKVKRLLVDIARDDPRSLKDEPRHPQAFLVRLAESSVEFELKFFVRDARERGAATSDVYERVLAAFEREMIEIPFPTRTLHVKSGGAVAVPVEEGATKVTRPSS